MPEVLFRPSTSPAMSLSLYPLSCSATLLSLGKMLYGHSHSFR